MKGTDTGGERRSRKEGVEDGGGEEAVVSQRTSKILPEDGSRLTLPFATDESEGGELRGGRCVERLLVWVARWSLVSESEGLEDFAHDVDIEQDYV